MFIQGVLKDVNVPQIDVDEESLKKETLDDKIKALEFIEKMYDEIQDVYAQGRLPNKFIDVEIKREHEEKLYTIYRGYCGIHFIFEEKGPVSRHFIKHQGLEMMHCVDSFRRGIETKDFEKYFFVVRCYDYPELEGMP